MKSHKFLFPDFIRPYDKYVPKFSAVARKDMPFTDDWGCIWETTEDGITGTVTKHPIDNWSALKEYKAPDPNKCMGIGPIDWNIVERNIALAKESGNLADGGLRHGYTFLQLCDIRGYQNLIFDMVDNNSNLPKLIDMI